MCESITTHTLICCMWQALSAAASILTSGGERLKRSQEQKKSTPDFHMELCKLRQNWRLKKAGDTILGDLSYKSGELCTILWTESLEFKQINQKKNK